MMTQEEKSVYQKEYEEYLDRMGFENYLKKSRLSPMALKLVAMKLFKKPGITVTIKDKDE